MRTSALRKPAASAAAQFDGGYVREDRKYWDHVYQCGRSIGLIGVQLLREANSRTLSAPPNSAGVRPEFYEIVIEDFADQWCCDRRAVEMVIGKLEEWGCIERRYPDRTHQRGGIRLRPENFHRIPRPQRICKTRTAAVSAPSYEMHFVSDETPGAKPISPAANPISPEAKCISHPAPAIKEETQTQTDSVVVVAAEPTTIRSVDPRSCSACGNRYTGGWHGHALAPSGATDWENAYLARFHDAHCELWRNHPSRSAPTFSQTVRMIAGIAIQALPALDAHFFAWVGATGRLARAKSAGVVNSWASEYGRAIAPAELAPVAAYAIVSEHTHDCNGFVAGTPVTPEAPAPRPCEKCRGTGKLHNLSDPEAYSLCGCAAGRAIAKRP